MKRFCTPLVMFALSLFVAALVAGISYAGTADDPEMIVLSNPTKEVRKFDVVIECIEETDEYIQVMQPGQVLQKPYTGHYGSLDQKWYIKVTNEADEMITDARVNYSDGKFSPGTIGEGLEYRSDSPRQFTLTITK
ncbi:hypothetical protein [Pseudodesulfovibrio sp.]|uniref:hypothetical protein n=1 Tax=unclassified Pseudodesulfovibrio TaxID=2661612 RepID=UPI003B0003D2